jgi:hypothetical protein
MQMKTSRRAVIKAALIAGVYVPTVYQLAHAAAEKVWAQKSGA